MKTSEQPRWSIDDLFAAHDEGDWDPEPDRRFFLGGCQNPGGTDYDLYLLEWVADDDGYQQRPTILGLRLDEDEDSEDTWDYYYEAADDVDSDSFGVLQEGARRARAEGLIEESDPRIETGRQQLLRAELPETLNREPIRSRALYLGGARVNQREFELYLVEETEHVPAVVFAVATDDSRVSRWLSDGSIPRTDADAAPYGHALREAIRRAREQGFEFRVDDRVLAQLEENTTTGAPAPEPATTQALVTTTQKGSEAQMMTQKPQVTKFTNVTVADSKDEVIHLPAGMTHAQAREWLTNDERNKEQEIQWSANFDAYPLDGALALRRVLDKRFGSAIKSGATEETFFGKVEVPPYMIEVQVGVDQVQHVPWGHFTIPLMPEHKIEAGVEYKEKQFFFQLTGKIRRKFKDVMDQIADQIREELKSGSIYKGKAFRLKFPTEAEASGRGYNPNDFAPKFINVAGAQDQLILSERVREQVETNLFTPVRHTAKCRKLGIPLKRGVLLEGKYGTGKTLTAAMLSRLCIENSWTFIYLNNVDDLDRAMRFANRYAPAVIFAEDIDQTMEQKNGSARDTAMNAILNTIDGVDMKKAELMVVLTTNFISKINKAMLRPGRLDAVITVEPPDEKAVIQLLRHYAKGLLDNQSDEALRPAASQLAGQIPATVREVVERSKLASVSRSGDSEEVTLLGEDLRIAAVGMLTHIRLLEDPPVDNRSDIEKAADTVVNGLIRISGVSAITNGLSSGTIRPALPKAVTGEAV